MPVETRSMRRLRKTAKVLARPTPSKSTGNPPTPTKKTKYGQGQQVQPALLQVTKPVVTATLPPSPPTTPPPKAAPATKKTSQKGKTRSLTDLNDSEEDLTPAPVPTVPPPSVSPEAAAILSKIDPDCFTPYNLQLGYFKAYVLSPSSPDYSTISEYIINSQAHGFQIDPISILKISRPASSVDSSTSAGGGAPVPKPFTMMLWHGTRPYCVASILYNGFKCPSTGNQMFGQGVYFADRISKSAQYTHPSLYCAIPKAGDVGYLFLCEVVLGKIYNAKNSNSAYKEAPTATRWDGSTMTFDSLMCTGAQVPDRERQREIDGITWPLGPTIANQKFPSYTVNYNEYIVYKPEEMVDIKYLVEVKFS